jgi:predicted RNase H-like nuclease (RuvC/YqgF family)
MNNVPRDDDREHRLIEAVVSLAKSFREERDRLARRLSQLEREIDALAVKLEQYQRELPEIPPPAAPPPAPSRTPS